MGVLEDLLKEDAEATGAETSTEKTEETTETTDTTDTTESTETVDTVEETPTDTTSAEEKTEEPTEESTKEETTETPVNEYWKNFGEFESEDDFKAKWEEFNSKPAPTRYATSLAEQFDNFVRNGGPDDLTTFKMIRDFSVSDNPTKEDMIDAIVAKRVMDDPDYKGMESQLANKIKKEYGLDISSEDMEFMEEDEKSDLKFKEVELKKEFKKAAKSFEELKGKTEPVKDEEMEKFLSEAPQKIQSRIQEVNSKGIEIPYPVMKKNDKGEWVSDGDNKKILTFAPEMMETYNSRYEQLSQAMGYSNLSDGSQNEEVETMSRALMLGSHFPQIVAMEVAKAVAEAQSKHVEDEMKDDNPSSVGTHTKTGESSEVEDRSGDIFG